MLIAVCGLALIAATEAGTPDVRLDGELVQGGIVRGTVAPGVRLFLDKTAVKVSADGRFVFGFGRDAPSHRDLRIVRLDGVTEHRRLTVARRDYDIQRVNGVPPETVTPPPSVLARIREEAAQVRAARAGESDRTDFAAAFAWPLIGPVTGVFGSQRVYNGEPRRPHYGVDIAAPVGTPVQAPAAGVVTLAHPDMFYSGGTLIVDHGHGLTSTFIHLDRVLVTVGQTVTRGEVIAEVGQRGRATGPHLDWRMNWRDRRVDPTTLVGPMPDGDGAVGGNTQ